jgi:hypothetical protein
MVMDSAVGIATEYGLDDRGVGFRVPIGAIFSPLHFVQTCNMFLLEDGILLPFCMVS